MHTKGYQKRLLSELMTHITCLFTCPTHLPDEMMLGAGPPTLDLERGLLIQVLKSSCDFSLSADNPAGHAITD